jgi:hypothetical protein
MLLCLQLVCDPNGKHGKVGLQAPDPALKRLEDRHEVSGQ